MDWHFRVHQRSGEAAKRGTHRSWYVDQQDWLKSRESVDTDHHHGSSAHDDAASGGEQAGGASGADRPKYIPVPDPSRGINTVCPICQDRFENKWLDTAQEWVWLDCVLVGGRAYHASCHAEATRDREGTPRRTPEPVLGKRKAEMGLASPKVRSLKTSA
jgi:pre-mRNA cleavage complex 2 protein Pcf11